MSYDIKSLMRRLETGDFTAAYFHDHGTVVLAEQSVAGAVDSAVEDAAQSIVAALPPNLASGGVRVERALGTNYLVITARGYQLDVVPTFLKIGLSPDEKVGFLTAVVNFDDGTYSARDMKQEREVFSIVDAAPVSDLVHMVTHWLRSRVREY